MNAVGATNNPPGGRMNPAGAGVSTPGSAPEAPASGLVQIAFKGRRLGLFANPEGLPLARGRAVVVEVERGIDLGQVFALDVPGARGRPEELTRVLRLATPEDLALLEELRREEPPALARVKSRVAHFALPMHMVDAEYQLDRNRVTFYFTADHRIDFRELVRDLAGIFRTRIELRQISTRDAARRLGGLGPCGLSLCCASFLHDFERVTLQMARAQGTTLNPARLSGLCGRLLCCLSYESCAARNGGEPDPLPCEGGCAGCADA